MNLQHRLGVIGALVLWLGAQACGEDGQASTASTGGAGAGAAGGGDATADSDGEGVEEAAGSGGLAGSSAGGAGGTGATACGSGGYGNEAGKCLGEQASMITFVKANKSCGADQDCVFVYSRSDIRDHCSGGFYLSKSYDQTEYGQLEAAVAACLGPDTNYCAATPYPAACWRGMCVPGGGLPLSARDECVAKSGSDDACALCACGLCSASACWSNAGCQALAACARGAGCLGQACGDPTSSNFPCPNELAQAGCASSPQVSNYFHLNQCLVSWQCAAACAP